jgi:hypothetical protein
VAPACFAAAKRPGTQDVQPAAAIAASATSCMVFGSSAPSRYYNPANSFISLAIFGPPGVQRGASIRRSADGWVGYPPIGA